MGRCKVTVTLFRAICECCADHHSYLINNTWLAKSMVLSQEGLSLGLLVQVLKHVKRCDKLVCKPVGVDSPKASSNTLMTTSLVSHFCHMILFLSIGFHNSFSSEIPGWLTSHLQADTAFFNMSSKGSPSFYHCSNSLLLCSLHIWYCSNSVILHRANINYHCTKNTGFFSLSASGQLCFWLGAITQFR